MTYRDFLTKWVSWPTLIEELGENIKIPRGVVLNAGSGIRSVAFPNAAKVVNMDIAEGKSVDVVGDLEQIPFEDFHFDSIVCIAVLEHCRRPWKVIEEFKRVLKPNGKLLCVVPFMQPIHLYPGDYFRYTGDGIGTLLEDNNFTIEKSSYTHSLFHILGWFAEDYFKDKSLIWSIILLPFSKLNFLLSKYFKFNIDTIPSVVTVIAIRK